LIEILTNRLMIVPCSLDIAKSLIFHRKELERRSPIGIPASWPSSIVKGFLPYYIEELEADKKNNDFGFWLIILYEEKKIIGDLVMEGRPIKDGTVSLDYHLDISKEKITDETIAYEAIDALIDWLTYQKSVKKIVMECRQDQEQVIHLLNRLGFICQSKEGSFLKWEMQKRDNL